MNHLIIYVLVITMCFGLNEGIVCSNPNNQNPRCGGAGCRLNTLELRNELGRGNILKVDCTSNQNKKTGPQVVKFNESYAFSFEEVHAKRIVWACHLRHGPKGEFYQSIWRAYRGAAKKRCAQIRTWVAKVDGIYLLRNAEPKGHQFVWLKS